MPINYTEELQRLEQFKPQEGGRYWRPKVGQHKITALGELQESTPFIEEGKEPREQVQLKILVHGSLDETPKLWTMAKGKSPASTYGQILRLAAMHNGKLEDVEFMVVVNNDGKKNNYTIVTL